MKRVALLFSFPASVLAVGLVFSPVFSPAQAQPDGEDASTPAAQWTTYKSDPQRTSATNARLGTPPNLIWRHSTDAASKNYDTSPLVVGPPGQHRVYFAAERTMFCIDGQTGAQIWRSQPLLQPVVSPIALVPGETGDMLLAVTSSGQLNALRTSDGGLVWQTKAERPVQNVAPIRIKTPAGERIILTYATGQLRAFTLQGQPDPSWNLKMGSYASAPTATPALSEDGKYLYVPTQDKRLFIIDIERARVDLPIPLRVASFVSPMVIGDHLIAVTGTTLLSLKRSSGTEQWVFDMKQTLSAPAARRKADGNATIFLGARNGRFYAINAATGAVEWSTDLADAVTGAPTVAEDMVLVGTRSGMLFGLAPADGKILWRYRLRTERVAQNRNRFDENSPGGGFQPINFGNQGFGRPGFGGSGFGRPGFGDPGFGRPGFDGPGGTSPAMSGASIPDDKNPPMWDDAATPAYPISSTPVVLDGQVYLLGDNAALYAFSTQPFDANPPQIFNPQLSVRNDQDKPQLQRMDTEKPMIVTGRAPLEFVAELTDVGSGVDPTSIRISFNKQELPASAFSPFADTTGKLLVRLAEPKAGMITNLEDGLQTISITARDYRGNELIYNIDFMVDNSVRPTRSSSSGETGGGQFF